MPSAAVAPASVPASAGRFSAADARMSSTMMTMTMKTMMMRKILLTKSKGNCGSNLNRIDVCSWRPAI